jgi:hypothetical protein
MIFPNMSILENDIGRPITHLSHKLTDFDPIAAARDVGGGGKCR